LGDFKIEVFWMFIYLQFVKFFKFYLKYKHSSLNLFNVGHLFSWINQNSEINILFLKTCNKTLRNQGTSITSSILKAQLSHIYSKCKRNLSSNSLYV
jgi:hypothetical protein